MKAAMAAVCERVVAVVDPTKLGQVGLARSVPLSRLAMVITDHYADPAILAEPAQAGVEVRLM